MRILVVGLGSMGKRRIRNLLFLGVPKEEIFGFDLKSDRTQEIADLHGIRTWNDFDLAMKELTPTALVISTPPDAHAPFFLRAAKEKIPFFVEVTTVDDGYAELLPLLDGSFVAAPSCTFRFFPAVRVLKERIEQGAIGKPLAFDHYLGQYLPDWHPFEDYRTVYFSRSLTGGAREMFPHELVWITHIFGSDANGISGFRGKVSDLEMTADDVYAAAVRLQNGVMGTLLVDLLNRNVKRTFTIIGSEGSLEWNWLTSAITLRRPQQPDEAIDVAVGEKIGHYNTSEDAYRDEMAAFLAALRGEKPFPYTFKEDWKILETLGSIRP